MMVDSAFFHSVFYLVERTSLQSSDGWAEQGWEHMYVLFRTEVGSYVYVARGTTAWAGFNHWADVDLK